jgi:FKBP-type peptidyl-prolyl cis-trans isomerase SlyD
MPRELNSEKNTMNITANTVVQLQYRIEDVQGEVVDAGDTLLTYLHGGYGEFFDKLEEKLEGQGAGFEGTFHLEPEDAFGEYDADLLRLADRTAFPEALEVGMRFEGVPDGEADDNADPEDDDQGRIFTVNEIADDKVLLDGNHPLAGIAIVIWLKVESVRAATAKELEQGYAGGVGLWISEDDISDEDEEEEDDEENVVSSKPTLH